MPKPKPDATVLNMTEAAVRTLTAVFIAMKTLRLDTAGLRRYLPS